MQAGNMSVSFNVHTAPLSYARRGAIPAALPRPRNVLLQRGASAAPFPPLFTNYCKRLGRWEAGVVGHLLSRLHVRVYWSAFVLLWAKNASSAD
jgi:hypothetical protein